MNVDLLETLVAVADEGGYTRAARTLSMSQPAVYQRLQRLEATVGSPLVRRAGRRVQLTPMGEVVYRHARQVIRQLRLLDDALAAGGDPAAGGTLSMLVGHSLSEFPVPDICVGFQQEHPDLIVDLRVTARTPRDLDREIAYGRADVGMHSDPAPVDGLAKQSFYEEEYVALAWPGHRFERLEMLSPRDFAGEPVVGFQDQTATFTQNQVDGWFAQAGVEPERRVISNSHIAIRELVARRVGVAIVPGEHAAGTRDLVVRPITEPPHRTLFFVSRVTPHESASLRLLRAYVLSRAWLRLQP